MMRLRVRCGLGLLRGYDEGFRTANVAERMFKSQATLSKYLMNADECNNVWR
jgi:hypothetical protein